MSGEERFSTLDAAFATAIEPWMVPGPPIALLFSGGVDSGLLAWELRRRPGLTLVTVGVRGSPDLRAAQEGAALIGARWTPFEVAAPEVRELADRIQEDTVDLPETARHVLVAFALAVEHTTETTVLCGQGADELFLGYAHFRGLGPAAAAQRSGDDLRLLLERDWPRAQKVAQRAGRAVDAPFLHPNFVASARAIPIEGRLPHPVPKALFREWASRRGVPSDIVNRPKRALQFGSGIDRLIPERPRGDSTRN